MKKKLLSLLLAATLVFSMFSFTAFAEEKTRTEQWFEKHSDEFHLKATMDFDETIEYEVYTKNGKMKLENMPSGDSKVDMIYDGEKCIIYYSRFPFLHFEFPLDDFEADSFDDLFPMTDIAFTYVGSTTKMLGSKEYYVELITDDEIYDESTSVVYEYWFDGEELVMITDANDPDIKLEIISTEIDDSEFEPPFFSINLTPFFEFFLRIFGFTDFVM